MSSYIFSKSEKFINCHNYEVTTEKHLNMKKQIFTSLFLAVLLMSVLSVAATNFTLSSSSLNVNQPTTTSSFTITPINDSVLSNYTVNSGTFTLDDNSPVTVSASPSSYLNQNSTFTVNVVTSSLDYSKMSVGKAYSAILKVNDNNNEQKNVSVSFARNFCDYGENGTKIKIIDIEDNDDFEWQPLNEVKIEVEVENNGNSREKVTVELGIYDAEDNKFVELDGNDEILEQSIRINDDDNEIFTFEFKVSPELEEDTDDRYRLYVKAYLDSDEAEACDSGVGSSLFEKVTIDYDDEDAVIDNIESSGTTVCGFTETVSMDVFNLAYGNDEDFRVNLYSKELGLDMNSDIFSLDNGDSEQVEFEFKVPSNVVEKTYKVYAVVEYNYKSSSDSFFDQSKEYYFNLAVENCEAPEAVITAELSSETPRAIIGSQVIIEATVKNSGTSSAVYSMSISGNSAWSTAAEIDPASFTLQAGDSKKVKIYLDVDADAEEGDREFTITTTYNGMTADQKVLLTLEKGFNTSKLANHFKEYRFIYLIGLITVILLIIVIILLVRRA